MVSPPEAQFLVEGLQRARASGRSFWDAICENWRFHLWQVSPPQGLNGSESPAQVMRAIAHSYACRGKKADARLWVDHTPWNTQYSLVLQELFPQAKFIHIVRDGRAVAQSVMQLDWGPTTPRSSATWWIERVAFGLASELRLPGQVLRVYYEDLVRDPVETLEKVCGFLELPYDALMLSCPRVAIPKYTSRQHELVGGKPDPSRIAAWREQLTPAQIRSFEEVAAEFLALLGYPPMAEISGSRSLHNAFDCLTDLRRRASQRLRHETRRRLADK
jgi:hypothetical protein